MQREKMEQPTRHGVLRAKATLRHPQTFGLTSSDQSRSRITRSAVLLAAEQGWGHNVFCCCSQLQSTPKLYSPARALAARIRKPLRMPSQGFELTPEQMAIQKARKLKKKKDATAAGTGASTPAAPVEDKGAILTRPWLKADQKASNNYGTVKIMTWNVRVSAVPGRLRMFTRFPGCSSWPSV